MKKTVLITGASSGIGKAATIMFAEKGYNVIGTARKIARMSDLKQYGIDTVALDVSKEESIQSAVEEIFSRHKQVDILVNNAGFSQNGFFEELTPESLRYQFEVNVFGLVRLTQMIVPQMRKRKSGRIINVGTVGGDFTTAGLGAYHASKYAIESFTDAMRMELKKFNIEVALIKPGGVLTNFVSAAESLNPDPIEGNPYGMEREKLDEMMRNVDDPKVNSFPMLKPEQVAAAIVKAAAARKPKTRYRVGSTAKMLPVLKRWMPDRMFDKMILRQFNMN